MWIKINQILQFLQRHKHPPHTEVFCSVSNCWGPAECVWIVVCCEPDSCFVLNCDFWALLLAKTWEIMKKKNVCKSKANHRRGIKTKKLRVNRITKVPMFPTLTTCRYSVIRLWVWTWSWWSYLSCDHRNLVDRWTKDTKLSQVLFIKHQTVTIIYKNFFIFF